MTHSWRTTTNYLSIYSTLLCILQTVKCVTDAVLKPRCIFRSWTGQISRVDVFSSFFLLGKHTWPRSVSSERQQRCLQAFTSEILPTWSINYSREAFGKFWVFNLVRSQHSFNRLFAKLNQERVKQGVKGGCRRDVCPVSQECKTTSLFVWSKLRLQRHYHRFKIYL